MWCNTVHIKVEMLDHCKPHHPLSTHPQAKPRRLAGLLLSLITLLRCYEASPTAASDSFCVADLETNEPCSNITIYDEVEKESIPFLELELNFTSSQLRINPNEVVKMFNDLYHDQSIGFILNAAGLSANNDVCQHKISKKLSPNSQPPESSFLTKYKCPWEYRCDYDPHRIPQVIWQADCSETVNSRWQCTCADGAGDCTGCVPTERKCNSVFYPVPVLYVKGSCGPFGKPDSWILSEMKVAVSCACNNNEAF